MILLFNFLLSNFYVILDELSIEEYMSIYELPQPQWAHLDQNVALVSVECFLSPKLFFVGNTKYNDG